MEGVRTRNSGFRLQGQDRWNMEQPCIATHPAGDRQGLCMRVAGPKDDGVEGLFMQVVKRRIGGERAGRLGAEGPKLVIQLQKAR